MDNVYTEIKPFYNLSKALGVFPKSFVGLPTTGNLETKWIDVASSSVSFLLALALMLLNIFLDDVPSSSSPILSRIWVIQSLQGASFIFIIFFYQSSKCKSIVKFIASLHQFDQKVTKTRLAGILFRIFALILGKSFEFVG